MSRKSVYVGNIKTLDTAGIIVDLLIKKNKKDIVDGYPGRKYQIREFSVTKSVDASGNEVMSPIFITQGNVLRQIQRGDSSYSGMCSKIERTIGIPDIPDISSFSEKICSSKMMSTVDIKKRLDRYLKKEKFEVKSLKEMCSTIDSSLNINTKAAIKTLKWLLDSGRGRTKKQIVKELYKYLYVREKDKLFYIRRHPSERMLHRCNDETILECIEHLAWTFVDGNPFKKIEGLSNAISTLN